MERSCMVSPIDSVAGATSEAIGRVLMAEGVSTEQLRETIEEGLPSDQGDD